MDTVIFYTGAGILSLLALALLMAFLGFTCLIAQSLYSIFTSRRTAVFLRKPENRATWKAADAAIRYLRRQGMSGETTIAQAERLIKDFHRRYCTDSRTH